MKQLIKTLLITLLVLVAATSCGKDEPDGKWDKMEWTVPSGIVQLEDGVYWVPASGGSFTFVCENYEPWIVSLAEYQGDAQVEHVMRENLHSYEGEWYSVKCAKKNVTFTFSPFEDDARVLEVTLTAGDIFCTLLFAQQNLLF